MTENSYKCPYCTKEFDSIKETSDHIWVDHPEVIKDLLSDVLNLQIQKRDGNTE